VLEGVHQHCSVCASAAAENHAQESYSILCNNDRTVAARTVTHEVFTSHISDEPYPCDFLPEVMRRGVEVKLE
jgi:hypothetical protein